MQYYVSLSIRGDVQAKHIFTLWPTLTMQQSVMARRVPAERRVTNFEGTVTDLMLLVEHCTLLGDALLDFRTGVSHVS